MNFFTFLQNSKKNNLRKRSGITRCNGSQPFQPSGRPALHCTPWASPWKTPGRHHRVVGVKFRKHGYRLITASCPARALAPVNYPRVFAVALSFSFEVTVFADAIYPSHVRTSAHVRVSEVRLLLLLVCATTTHQLKAHCGSKINI